MTSKSEKKEFDGITLNIPRKTAYVRFFTLKTGENRCVIKLPPYTPPLETDEGLLDVSRMSLFCSSAQLKSYNNDPAYYHVILPSKNAKGEPWEVILTYTKGHYENPEGKTKQEKGAYIVDEEEQLSVDAKELARALEIRRQNVRAYASAKAENSSAE